MSSYVRNAWYMAAWAEQVPDGGFLSRRLLDRLWLIWRLSDGSIAMIEDRCPHRFVALSKGRRDGDRVVCGYHGLGFDSTGQCVHSPFPDVQPRAQVATMYAVERHLGIWFWPGDPALADPASIPDYAYLDGDRPAERGHLVIKGNYELMTDNLMDLTHAEFIHVESFGTNGSIFIGKQSVKQEPDGAIWNNWDIAGAEPPGWAAPMLEEGAKIDQWLHMRWHAPANMDLSIGIAKADSNRAELVVPPLRNPHIVTPETTGTSHYFYDHAPGEAEAAQARRVFLEEDEPMIESAEEALAGQDFWDARPLILASDAGAIRARRRLMQMRRSEAVAANEA
ncbi:aromatic ring-hydroxylating dioxygenase subunit alpha [Sphingomonas sp. SUN039]|uniref:aromatic ring-hydroxylating dioxygenase subunit alpha n=1 Tax=Sphingomonas sp. SUN039 TaxID=2937787 RepID=UPI002164010F|nr:aromatic ring-hydroxylating dioxygenase subunit alpha [Sphingomonas sp. SUN039]UVO53090.1 aromatic ring-hydroxylating dioxygenase subunit alpha [Sphingomonas sp. SUN039]